MFVTFLSASHMHLMGGILKRGCRMSRILHHTRRARKTIGAQPPKECDSHAGSDRKNDVPAVQALSKPFRDGVLVGVDTALDSMARVL